MFELHHCCALSNNVSWLQREAPSWSVCEMQREKRFQRFCINFQPIVCRGDTQRWWFILEMSKTLLWPWRCPKPLMQPLVVSNDLDTDMVDVQLDTGPTKAQMQALWTPGQTGI